jgi:polysaccharide chain length determinant protein (PEP-CTERM system associated)
MLPGKQITLSDIVRMVRRRAWLIVLPPLVTAFAALLYSSRVPNLYQSDMLVAIDPQRVPEGFVQSTVTLRTEIRMNAISVQVMSRTNLERMIESLNLYPEERKVLPMEDVVLLMRESINYEMERPRGPGREPNEAPNAFHVRFTYPDASVAAQVTQQLGSLFVEQNARDRGALATATNSFLETQLAEARERLEVQERRLESFRQKYGKELPTQLQTNLQASISTQMQIQNLVESMARDKDRKLLVESLHREAVNAPVFVPPGAAQPANGSAAAVPATGTAAQQLAAARTLLGNLELRFRAEHPDVIRTRRLIAELEIKAKAEESAVADRTSTAPAAPASEVENQRRERLSQMVAEIESLDRQIKFKEKEEQRLRGEVAEFQRRIEAVPGVESDWVALTRDYETQQAAYRDLLSKSGAAKVAVDLEQQQIGEHFRIVDPANVPVHPLPSIRMRINAMGLALGLVIGLGIVAFLELRDASFRSDDDVLEVLSLTVLAQVPRIETAAERRGRLRRNVVLSVAGAACLAGAGYVTWTLKLWQSLN